MEFKEPIQLTYLINTLSVGGAERGMARLLSELPAERFDTTVIGLATHGGDIIEQLPDHVTIVDLHIDSAFDILRLRKIWSELAETDVLVTSLYHATQIGRVLGTLCRVPAILSWQHNERLEKDIRQRLFGTLSFLDTMVLADSQAAASGAIESGIDPARVRRVPIAGIDITDYEPVTHSSTQNITVGTVGRLAPQKNMWAVLDVADKLRAEPIEFRIAGKGPQQTELDRYARENNIYSITFEGFVQSVPNFLSEIDIYFQPSRREGLCITVLEAMAAGLPIVASSVGGITETVIPEKTGILAAPDDIETFAEQILELSDSPDRRASYGSAGRRRVAEKYSHEQLVEEFLNIIEAI